MGQRDDTDLALKIAAPMQAMAAACAIPVTSGEYWSRIFRRNPEFCSWRASQQAEVLEAIKSEIDTVKRRRIRVLDFGIGSLGLYRALDDSYVRAMVLTGISESKQHNDADPWIAQHSIRIFVGPGVKPLYDLTPSSFDMVICTYVFAYLSDEMRARALAGFCRALAPGGKLLLVLHHPEGDRARKITQAKRYWPLARHVYTSLLNGNYALSKRLLLRSLQMLDHAFSADYEYLNYLVSYLRSADQVLERYIHANTRVKPIPDVAIADCEGTLKLIDREVSMTCDRFHPVKDPEEDLTLPSALALHSLRVCRDPRNGAPMANVLTAIKRPVSA